LSIGLGVGAGALLGALLSPGADWKQIDVGHARVSLVMPRVRRGMGLSLSVGF